MDPEGSKYSYEAELLATLVEVTDRVGVRAIQPYIKGRLPEVVQVPRPWMRPEDKPSKITMTPAEAFKMLGAMYVPDPSG